MIVKTRLVVFLYYLLFFKNSALKNDLPFRSPLIQKKNMIIQINQLCKPIILLLFVMILIAAINSIIFRPGSIRFSETHQKSLLLEEKGQINLNQR
jgi:hypothetical protein